MVGVAMWQVKRGRSNQKSLSRTCLPCQELGEQCLRLMLAYAIPADACILLLLLQETPTLMPCCLQRGCRCGCLCVILCVWRMCPGTYPTCAEEAGVQGRPRRTWV
jgi:hypothetical protein